MLVVTVDCVCIVHGRDNGLVLRKECCSRGLACKMRRKDCHVTSEQSGKVSRHVKKRIAPTSLGLMRAQQGMRLMADG